MIIIRLLSIGPPGLQVMKHRRAELEHHYRKQGIPCRVSLFTVQMRGQKVHLTLAGGRKCEWPDEK
jgi:hypothetical protein